MKMITKLHVICKRKWVMFITTVIGIMCLLTSTEIYNHYPEESRKVYFNRGGAKGVIQSEHNNSTLTKNDRTPKDVRKILVLTYMRAGSSFTAESLQQGDGESFYSFEPLWRIFGKGYVTPDKVCYRNNTCRVPMSPLELPETVISILKDIFNCQIAKLPQEVLYSFSKFDQNPDHEFLKKCFPVPKDHRKRIPKTKSKRSKCIEFLEQKCHNSKLRIVKSIRVSFLLAEDILQKIEGLDILHLVRDPRAIIHSRLVINDFNAADLIPHVKQLCHMMATDIAQVQRLHISYPERVYTLMYECLAQNPDILREIYNDLSLPFVSKTEMWLKFYAKGESKSKQQLFIDSYKDKMHKNKQKGKKNTEKGKNSYADYKNTGYNVYRSNSSRTSKNWRMSMSYDQVMVIDELCADVYTTLGTRVFNSQTQLRNLSISEKVKTKYTGRYCKDG